MPRHLYEETEILYFHLKMALLTRASANVILYINNCYNCYSKVIFNFANARKCTKYTGTVFSGKWLYNNKRIVHTAHSAKSEKNKFIPYDEVIKHRRQQAARSVLIQVQSEKSCNELYSYCSQFGRIESMHHYTLHNNTHFVLIEFKKVSDVENILNEATHMKEEQIIPVEGSMLWFRTSKTGTKISLTKDIPLLVKNSFSIPTDKKLTDLLLSAETISDQMVTLHETTKLNDICIRIRFQTANQLERCFSGLFPHISVLPFGSSVNGFGKLGCDLDLVLRPTDVNENNLDSRLVYHTKTLLLDEKLQAKKFMETIADTMQHFVPGIRNVRRILHARVPIIKYDQYFTGLECDLSMTNLTAVYMSELLSLYGEIDWRVRPLVFTLRKWAECVGLTNSTPGRWITNFSLTLLVLFYLQVKQILPSLSTLKKLAVQKDTRLANSMVDCTFLRDLNRLPERTTNMATLQELLHGFYEFYSQFDFHTKAVSIRDGSVINKPDYSALYICNPLEPTLNVSKNVSPEELERLKVTVRTASWLMESTDNKNLLTILQYKNDLSTLVKSKRVVNFAALFGEDSENGTTNVATNRKTFDRKLNKDRVRRRRQMKLPHHPWDRKDDKPSPTVHK